MKIIVKTFANEEVIVEANASDTLAAMKARLPIPPHPDLDIDTDFHIMVKLASDMPLSARDLKHGDVLCVVRNCEHQVFGIVDEPSPTEYSTHSSGELVCGPKSKSSEEFEELLADASEYSTHTSDGP